MVNNLAACLASGVAAAHPDRSMRDLIVALYQLSGKLAMICTCSNSRFSQAPKFIQLTLTLLPRRANILFL